MKTCSHTSQLIIHMCLKAILSRIVDRQGNMLTIISTRLAIPSTYLPDVGATWPDIRAGGTGEGKSVVRGSGWLDPVRSVTTTTRTPGDQRRGKGRGWVHTSTGGLKRVGCQIMGRRCVNTQPWWTSREGSAEQPTFTGVQAVTSIDNVRN